MTNATLATFTAVGLALGFAADALAQREAAAENFSQADTNGDVMLSFSEFATFINLNADDSIGRAGMIRRAGAYRRAFGRLDTNRNGLVTRDELAAGAQAVN